MQSVPASEVQAQLERIVSSKVFVQSRRLCKFLRYTVGRTLAGDGDSLKEYTIGREVFERDDAYDPHIDSIVRVEAQRLRRKLKEYYDGLGALDPVRVNFQLGGYAPSFEWQHAAADDAVPMDPNTVAVLPFSNLSRDPHQTLFGEGTAEEIIHRLTVVEHLNVLGMHTVSAMQKNAGGLQEACRPLGVGTLVDGSVRKSGNFLRITAKAIEVTSGRILWSRTFDRREDDIFAIQEEIAHEVASALDVQLHPPEPARTEKVPNLQAYKLYLQGRHLWDASDRATCQTALDYFQHACTLAPNYALPLAGLADTYHAMALWGWMRPREAMPMSKRAALEALRIYPELGEAYASLSTVLGRYDWDWPAAEQAAIRAIELNPGYGWAHMMKAYCALATARFPEALESAERAMRLDPLSHRVHSAKGILYWLMGDVTEAEKWFREGQKMNRDLFYAPYFLTMMYLATDRPQEALAEIEACRPAGPNDLMLAARGQALSRCGRREEAEQILATLVDQARIRYVDPLAAAQVQLSLGQLDAAMESLLQGAEERSPLAAFVAVHPLFRPLRKDARFQTLLRAMGIPSRV